MRIELIGKRVHAWLRGDRGDVLLAMGDRLDLLGRELKQESANLIEGKPAPVLELAEEEKSIEMLLSVACIPPPRIGAGQKPFVDVIANGTGAETALALEFFEGVFPSRHTESLIEHVLMSI